MPGWGKELLGAPMVQDELLQLLTTHRKARKLI